MNPLPDCLQRLNRDLFQEEIDEIRINLAYYEITQDICDVVRTFYRSSQ